MLYTSADRGDRTRVDERLLERLARRALEPAVEVRSALEDARLVALVELAQQIVGAVQAGMVAPPLVDARRAVRLLPRGTQCAMVGLVPVLRRFVDPLQACRLS